MTMLLNAQKTTTTNDNHDDNKHNGDNDDNNDDVDDNSDDGDNDHDGDYDDYEDDEAILMNAQPTDQRTDADTAHHRDARTHLKAHIGRVSSPRQSRF